MPFLNISRADGVRQSSRSPPKTSIRCRSSLSQPSVLGTITDGTLQYISYVSLPNMSFPRRFVRPLLVRSARGDLWVRQRLLKTHLRYGSLADIGQPIRDVRFAPESRHVRRRNRCLLCATSGHSDALAHDHNRRCSLRLPAQQLRGRLLLMATTMAQSVAAAL